MTIYRTWICSDDKVPEEVIKSVREKKKLIDPVHSTCDEECPELSKEILRKMVEDRKKRLENPSNRVARRAKIVDPRHPFPEEQNPDEQDPE